MAQPIDEIIAKVKSATTNITENADELTTLLQDFSHFSEPNTFDNFELTELFVTLLETNNTNVQREAAKCIAEMTKSEIQRKKFTKSNVIQLFINCLKSIDKIKNNLELTIQICRALGNICYLNDNARNLVLDIQGDEALINLLDINVNSENTNDAQFIKVRGGLLSNYLLGGENYNQRAMELKIMEKMQSTVDDCISDVNKNELLLLNTLPIFSLLTENVAELNFELKLNTQLAEILAASTNPDLAEMCLELLHYQAENDDVKLLLAKAGLCETIFKLLEKYKTLANSSEARALMKLACDLIVLILTGDEAMNYLYSTKLLKNMEDWLDSTDVDLLTTGVLALGNFARTDSHCIYLVENKIMDKLLAILSKNNSLEDNMRLQHGLLSALRNLVIPKPNKTAVIKAGLVETILPMLQIHQPPVLFKLLGTLRMTVDGQEKLALDLLQNKTLIEQLVHWSKSDYAGVTGESLRLMAWLIKHAYLMKTTNHITAASTDGNSSENTANDISSQPKSNLELNETSLKIFAKTPGTVESMIQMLTSQHLVMQNEALIALCILSVVFLSKSSGNTDDINLEDMFVRYELGKNLAELIQRSSDNMTKEIVENLQNFIKLLNKSQKLVKHLEENNISELLKSIPILTEYCTL